MANNEEYWLEVYEAKAVADRTGDKTAKLCEWLQLMENDGKIRGIDLMRLKNVLDLAYEIGYEIGQESV